MGYLTLKPVEKNMYQRGLVHGWQVHGGVRKAWVLIMPIMVSSYCHVSIFLFLKGEDGGRRGASKMVP